MPRIAPVALALILIALMVAPADAADGLPPKGLPSLVRSQKNASNNQCPVCGKSRNQCFELYEKSKTDPSLRSQVCSIYRDEFKHGRTRPFNCPCCRHKVNITLDAPAVRKADRDLCPYPIGRVKHYNELVICPQCGFSAYQHDFMSPVPATIPAWVNTNLRPILRRAEHQLLDMRIDVSEEELVNLFEKQANIPDTLRAGNAFAYYSMQMKQNPKIEEASLARLAYMAAWAHRRNVNSELFDGSITPSVKRILEAIQKHNLDESDLEGHVRVLTQLYQNPKYSHIDRQVIRFLQAGYYNRLGLNYWADAVLRQIQEVANAEVRPTADDPWFACFKDDMPNDQRIQAANDMRLYVKTEAEKRLNSLREEHRYLGHAVNLICTAIKKKQYAPQELPSHIYLVGEFERRRERLSRALLWLSAANQLLGEEIRIEHFAPEQIDLMKRYVTDRQFTPPTYPQKDSEWQFLQALARDIRTEQARDDSLTSVPPASE